MIKWLGLSLTWGGCILWGLQAGAGLHRRVRVVEDVAQGLEQLCRELTLHRWALPELLEQVSRHRSTRQGRDLFQNCHAELGKGRNFTAAWTSALRKNGLDEIERLDGLSQVLGHYAAQEQAQALEQLCDSLQTLCRQERERARERCKVYGALGVAAGGFTALMLL